MCLLLVSKVDFISAHLGDIIDKKEDGHVFSTDDLLVGEVWPVFGNGGSNITVKQYDDYVESQMPAYGEYCRLPVPANIWTRRSNLDHCDAWNDNGTWRRITKRDTLCKFTAIQIPEGGKEILADINATNQQKFAVLNYVRCNWFLHTDNQQEIPNQ